MLTEVQLETRWRHRDGNFYVIKGIFPWAESPTVPIIWYQDELSGKDWCHFLKDFLQEKDGVKRFTQIS